MLNWRSLPYERSKELVVGTYLACSYVGKECRFAVYERRTRAWDEADKRYYPSISYDVKDAETSTDEDIRAGRLPKTVFRSDDLDACVGWVERQQ